MIEKGVTLKTLKIQTYLILFVVSSSLLFSACSLNQKTKTLLSSTGIGCAAGLVAGTVYDEIQRKKDGEARKKIQNQVSSIFKQRKSQNNGKIVGLGAGCLAGLGVGYYLNTMYDDMQGNLGEKGVKLEKVTDASGETSALKVSMDGGMSFQPNQSAFAGIGESNVKKLADALKEYPETNLKISGHTSPGTAPGAQEFIKKLSLDRANAARKVLVDSGIEEKRITETSGLADTKPIPGTNPASDVNKRVEILITGE